MDNGQPPRKRKRGPANQVLQRSIEGAIVDQDEADNLRIKRLQRSIIEDEAENEDRDDDEYDFDLLSGEDICAFAAHGSSDTNAAALDIIHHNTHIIVSVFRSALTTEQNQTNNARPCLEDVLVTILRDAAAADQAEDNGTFDEEMYEGGWEKSTFLQRKALEAIMDVGRALFLKHAPPPSTLAPAA